MVPACTAQNTLIAAIGPADAMERFWVAHRDLSPGHRLLLGSLVDHNEHLEATLRDGGFQSREEFRGYVTRKISRFFKVDISTLSGITA